MPFDLKTATPVAAPRFDIATAKPEAPAPDPRTPDYNKVFTDTGGLASFRRGTQDIIDRVAQVSMNAGEKLGLLQPGIADIGTAQMNEEQAAFDAAREAQAGGEKPGFNFARAGGSVAPLAPLALLPGGQGVLGRIGAGAVSGGLTGALQYDPTNTTKGTVRNTAIGAGLGAALNPAFAFIGNKAVELGSNLVGRFKGAAASVRGATTPQSILRDIPEAAQLPPRLRGELIDEAAQQIRQTGALNKEALARKANLQANDAIPLKSMVTRNPQDFALERNLSKLTGPDPELARIGGELTNVYSANDKALAGKLSSFSAELPRGTQERLGQNVLEAADDLSRSTQKEVSEIYETIRQQSGDNLASDARKIYAALDDLSDSPAADAVTQAAKRRLTKLGMLDPAGNLTERTLTVKQAEGLRQFINQQPSGYGKSQLIRAIDEDVLSGAGADAFAPARQAARERFAALENPATQKALGAVGELSQGKTSQNFIKSQVVDAAEQDVGALLDTFGKNKQAKESIQAGVLNYFESKAVNANSGQFSGANLTKALDQFGDGKLARVFGIETASKLRSLARAGIDATYQPPYAAVNSSNSGTTLLSLVNNARKLPGVPLLVTDALKESVEKAALQKQLQGALSSKSTLRIPRPTIGSIRGATPTSVTAIDQLNKSGRR